MSPNRRTGRFPLFLTLLPALLLGGCSSSTTPDSGDPADGTGTFDGTVDPTEGTFVMKTVEIPVEDGAPIRVELVGRLVRPGNTPGTTSLAVAVRNIDRRTLYAPGAIALTDFHPRGVYPTNADRMICPSDTGGPPDTVVFPPDSTGTGDRVDPSTCTRVYNYSHLLGDDGVLSSGETSGDRLWTFANPSGGSFSFRAQARFALSTDRARIAGTVYGDANRNGTRDRGEPGFSGSVVEISGPDGRHRAQVDDRGRYRVPVERAGLYLVRAYPPPTFAPVEPTSPNPLEVVIVRGPNGEPQSFLDADFGFANLLRDTTECDPVNPPDSTQSAEYDPYFQSGIGAFGNVLKLTVGFSGCGPDHPFALYQASGIMESEPPRVRVRLSHDDRGELCDAAWSRDLCFDLSRLIREAGGRLIVIFVDHEGNESELLMGRTD